PIERRRTTGPPYRGGYRLGREEGRRGRDHARCRSGSRCFARSGALLFRKQDALMTELAKALSMELRDSVDADETVWQDAGSGIEALQQLVRAGLELMW